MSLSRRELLAGFLGVPAALAVGCGGPVLPSQGEIVGASHGLGHRIRDGFRPRPAEDRWKEIEVVIVGGGVAGLSAARQLERGGLHDFVLLELEPEPGGTSRSGESSLTAFPWGAHYLPLPLQGNAPLLELLNEMGALDGTDDDGEPRGAEEFLCRDPEERLFANGRWHEGLFPTDLATPDDLAQLERFRREIDAWAAWRDSSGRRAFALPTSHSSGDAEATALDRETVSDWLDRHQFTSPRLRWNVDYACRDDYGLTASQTSAWAGLFYFCSRVRRPGEHSRPLLTWPEGNGRLVRHLADGIRDRVFTGHAVTEITPREGESAGVDVIAMSSRDGIEEIAGFRARHVIFAAPQFLARHLIAGYREARPQTADFEYGSWMVANLHLSSRPRSVGFPLCWDNVIEKSPSLGYVVATHQLGIDVGPTVFTYYYPLCYDDPKAARNRLLSLDWKHWADVCLSDLEVAHPDLRPLVQRLDVMRWGHAMIRPKPGFIWGSGRARAVAPYRRVHFAHSDLSGIALFEEAFDHGYRAANEVLRARPG